MTSVIIQLLSQICERGGEEEADDGGGGDERQSE